MYTNEIQTLRREVDVLRDENIALYNELTKQNKTLCEEIISLREQVAELYKTLAKQNSALDSKLSGIANGSFDAVQNLQRHLIDLAGRQTAEFIAQNMLEVKTFANRAEDGLIVAEDYLKYVLSQTTDSGGDLFLEFGVFGGRSIALSAWAMPDKIFYGFDSFEGLPEKFTSKWDKGSFTLRGITPIVPDNVRLIKGWFNETLPAFVKNHPQKCAFIHVDCDLYSSTKTIFDTLKNQIGTGTVIAFDEYFDYPGWQKYEYKAFMEFIAETGLEFEYIARTDYQQAAVRIK